MTGPASSSSLPELPPPSPAHVAQMLNEHGYPFHYAVLNRARELNEFNTLSPWVFEVSELPVMVGGKDTRIDFVLRHAERPVFLSCECKRVNPAYTDWCFFRAPLVRRNDFKPQFWIEQWRQHPGDPFSFPLEGVPRGSASGRDYHVAFPVEGPAKGNKSGGDPKEAIEAALTQASRHANGFAKLLCDRPSLVRHTGPEALIAPVVFTTARLWTSEVDLATADLTSGHVNPRDVTLTRRDWIGYQYHTSQGLRPGHTALLAAWDLSTYLVQEVMRTIFVVSTSGIDAFLGSIGDIF